MIGLISTPSTRDGAEDQRRQQIASAAGADDQRVERSRRPGMPARAEQPVAERRQLVLQVRDVFQVAAELQDLGRRRPNRCPSAACRAADRCSVAQRPRAVRLIVDADARKRVPLAEEHRVVLMALGRADVESRPRLATPSDDRDDAGGRGERGAAAPPAPRSRPPRPRPAAPRRRSRPARRGCSAPASAARQPAPAPSRSAA